MKRYNIQNLLGRIAGSLCAAAAIAALTFSGCTEVDDSLGSEFIPNDQQMKIGFRSLKPCVRTSLYRTDSIRTSNLKAGLLGSTLSDTFGLRTAGFYTQYTWGYCPDSTDGFGNRAIFDSIQLGFLISSCGGDTTAVRTYEVYEVVKDGFLAENPDTLFYGTFDMTPYLSAEPLFTFEFPNQAKGVYTTSTAVTMQPTASGLDFIERLMLKKGAYAGNDMKGFYDAADWVKHFKGVYIKPRESAASKESGIYQLDLSQSGMILYGRNRDEVDPSLIRDTTTSLYYFYDGTAAAGKASINTIEHDYAQSLLAGKHFEEKDAERSLTETCYVEGMAGVVTEIKITEEFFRQVEDILNTERDEVGAAYSSLAVNQARMAVYDSEGDYVWENVHPSEEMIWRMDTYMPRLGLYTSYKKLAAIADYDYVYEKTYQVSLPYGGYLNRSRGCYAMNVTLYIQSLWNKYRELKRTMPGKSVGELVEELGEEARTLYLAPEAYGVNTFAVMAGQGMEGGGNRAPIQLEITYTLIK